MTFPEPPPSREIVRRTRRCAVCSPGADASIRDLVDRAIVGGATAAEAYRILAPINEARVERGEPEISYQSVVRHGREHLPAKAAAVREIVERRARAAGLDVEEGSVNIITTAAYAEAVMTRAFQDMATVEVSVSDGLAAAKFLNQLMMAEKGNVGVETAFAELGYLIEAVKESVPQQYWSLITAKIEEKRGTRIIDAQEVEEFDPGEQPEEEFNPIDDSDEDF